VRFPLDPLYDLVPPAIYGRNNDALATALDLPVKTVRQWQYRGLSTVKADRIAIQLGLHPSAIWKDWFDSLTDEPRCRWCGQPTAGKPTCSRHHGVLAGQERRRVAANVAEWWTRMDRNRENYTEPPLPIAAPPSLRLLSDDEMAVA
jgi:hypothetical protein